MSATKFTTSALTGAGLADAKMAAQGGDGTKGYLHYDQDTWTPVLTFATPGDLAVAYTIQKGRYIRVGNLVQLMFSIVTSAYTFTTGSGAINITGSPFTAITDAGLVHLGPIRLQGVTKANFTDFNASVASGASSITISACGSAQAAATVNAADTSTGNNVAFIGHALVHL